MIRSKWPIKVTVFNDQLENNQLHTGRAFGLETILPNMVYFTLEIPSEKAQAERFKNKFDQAFII